MLQTLAVATAEASSSSEITTAASGLSASDLGAIALTAIILGTLVLIACEAGFTKRNR